MIIGIDLGTTNSLAACFTKDGPVIIPNRQGKRLTPSAVSVDGEGNVYVGDAAVDEAGARKAGVPFIRAAYGFGTPEHYDGKLQRMEDLLTLA